MEDQRDDFAATLEDSERAAAIGAVVAAALEDPDVKRACHLVVESDIGSASASAGGGVPGIGQAASTDVLARGLATLFLIAALLLGVLLRSAKKDLRGLRERYVSRGSTLTKLRRNGEEERVAARKAAVAKQSLLQREVNELRLANEGLEEEAARLTHELSLVTNKQVGVRNEEFDRAFERLQTSVALTARAPLIEHLIDVVARLEKMPASSCRLNGAKPIFQRRFGKGSPGGRALLSALGYKPCADGFFEIPDSLATAQKESGFFRSVRSKLEEAASACRMPHVEALGLAFMETSSAGPFSNQVGIRWTACDAEAAEQIYVKLVAKAKADESAAACLWRLMQPSLLSSSSRTTKLATFQSGKTMYDLMVGGKYALYQLNRQTKYMRSVSFFGDDGRPREPEILVNGVWPSPDIECEPGQPTRSVDRDAAVSKAKQSVYAALADTGLFRRLPAGDALFCYVADRLRKSLPRDLPVCVVAVHAVQNGCRAKHFALARELMTASRGSGGVNETEAFHGTSLVAVDPICRHGFALRERNHSQFGVGTYFSLAGKFDQQRHSTPIMAFDERYSSPDSAGLQHLLLCRILRGSMEQIKDGGGRGNPQFQPSSPHFDSGIDVHPDDAESAVRLIIWGSNLSTHVLPIAVVSVRVLDLTKHDRLKVVDGTDPDAPDVDGGEGKGGGEPASSGAAGAGSA